MRERVTIKAGKDYSPLLSRLHDHLTRLDDGIYQIIVEPYKRNRSLQQNRYMWGVVYKLIADHTGYTPDEVHDLMKVRFLSYDKHGYQFAKRTSKLSTAEFEDYLETIRRFAAVELGVAIPDPNEDI